MDPTAQPIIQQAIDAANMASRRLLSLQTRVAGSDTRPSALEIVEEIGQIVAMTATAAEVIGRLLGEAIVVDDLPLSTVADHNGTDDGEAP